MSIKFFTNVAIDGYKFYKNDEQELVLCNNDIDIISFSNDPGIPSEPLPVSQLIPAGNNKGDYLYWSGTNWAVGNNGTIIDSNPIAIGHQAGHDNQCTNAVAIGKQAGFHGQGTNAVAIGKQAGMINQGNNAIAIGGQAGCSNQNANSVVINASGGSLNTTSSGFYVAPITSTNNTSNFLVYNTGSNEICYSTKSCFVSDSNGNFNIKGNVTANSFITASDKRLKENIISADLEKCENIVKNLPLHRYKWKDSVANKADHHELGWIAQEVQEIFPKSIHLTPEDYLFLCKDQVYAAMYGALQSALLSIDLLKERITSLELSNKNF